MNKCEYHDKLEEKIDTILDLLRGKVDSRDTGLVGKVLELTGQLVQVGTNVATMLNQNLDNRVKNLEEQVKTVKFIGWKLVSMVLFVLLCLMGFGQYLKFAL